MDIICGIESNREHEGIFVREIFLKAQVVDAIKDFIPNFALEEKGKEYRPEDVRHRGEK